MPTAIGRRHCGLRLVGIVKAKSFNRGFDDAAHELPPG